VNYLGLPLRTYRYFDAATGGVDFEGMIADLGQAKAGDVVLLHGCCHNPTGANPNLTQWGEIVDTLLKTGATAMVDLAYQGFGDGLDADAAPTRLLARRLPELLIAASCSKNFGVYRERAGLLVALAPSSGQQAVTQANLATLNRLTYSFPPDHGARLVTTVLTDPTLRADWEAELEEVRLGMLSLRQQLADALRQETGSDRFGFIAAHRGMFSRIGATPEQVDRMRTEFGIYMVGDSRMNIAGLNAKTVLILAKAIKAVGA
jgi:aromatic-amino-acid transaminase